MGCGCKEIKRRPADELPEFVWNLAIKENRNYVIYEFEKKKTFDAIECWANGDYPGVPEILIVP